MVHQSHNCQCLIVVFFISFVTKQALLFQKKTCDDGASTIYQLLLSMFCYLFYFFLKDRCIFVSFRRGIFILVFCNLGRKMLRLRGSLFLCIRSHCVLKLFFQSSKYQH